MDFNLEDAAKHAIECHPMEACGLFIEAKGRVEFFPCGSSMYHDRFLIPPSMWIEAEGRGRLAGVFHSHCGSPPLPSRADLASMEAWGIPWVIMSAPSMEWAQFEPQGGGGGGPRPLLGREFAYGSLDCYGLLRDYYSRLGIDLPDFERSPKWESRGLNLYLDNYEKAGFSRLGAGEAPLPHDVLLMQINSPVPNHGAVYLGGDRILHHLEGRLSARAVWGDFFRKATTHILRHGQIGGAP
jgi:proteasome lid subunit RPN8/RPN11